MTTLLTQFMLRYRNALLTRALVLGGLGLLLAGLVAWRLSALPLAVAWRIGVPAVAGLGGLGMLAWWAYRRWPSQRASAAHLDRMLGLKQRLVTAEEFSRLPNPPALYPLLMEDVIRRATSPRAAYPRAVDRTTVIFALLLLLLLLWPLGGRSPLTQLAQLTKPTPPPNPSAPPPPPDQLSPPPQQQSGSQQSPSSAAQSSGGQGQSQSSEQHAASSQSQGGQNQSQQTAGGESSSSQDGQRGSGQDAGSTNHAEGANRGQQSSETGKAQQSGKSGGQGGQGEQQPSGGAQQSGAQPAGQQPEKPGGKSGAESSAGSNRGQPSSASAQQRAGAGTGAMSSQAQQALQQDIQQLLKDVSGELKDLQKRLESQDQPPPGSSTDPELYGGSPDADKPSGTPSAVPMSLETDTKTAGRSRKSSGTGRTSGEMSTDAPTAKPEPAQLADDPLEEPAGSRETVPPEYQDVFEQLNRSPEHQSTAR